jgi:thiamine-monophosphate kinase
MAKLDEESGEDRLIATYFRPIATHPGAFGLTDDAAAIAPPPGCDLVLKTDGVISGVHFFAEDPADTVARKALRINLSDLAAKGAAPLGFLLSIGLPAGLPPDWLKSFAQGLREDAAHYRCPLLGGDTDRSPGAITVYIAAIGTVPHGTMVRRAGAREGDLVMVTGTIGDAALGLVVRKDASAAARWKLDDAMRDHLLGRYLVPLPRRCVAMPAPRSMCPTALPAISANCAASPASAPRLRSGGCRCRPRRARCSRATRRRSRPSSPAVMISRSWPPSPPTASLTCAPRPPKPGSP